MAKGYYSQWGEYLGAAGGATSVSFSILGGLANSAGPPFSLGHDIVLLGYASVLFGLPFLGKKIGNVLDRRYAEKGKGYYSARRASGF